MGKYKFALDIEVAQETEKQIAKLLQSELDCEIVKFGNTSDYDILVTKDGIERTIEVKEDFLSKTTGNLALEYESRGKLSGISVSKADYYLYKVYLNYGIAEYWIIETDKLKSMVKFELFFKKVSGGDVGSNTKIYLFKLFEFKKFAVEIKVPLCIDYETEKGLKKCIWYEGIVGKEGVCLKPNVAHFLCEYSLKNLSAEDYREI